MIVTEQEVINLIIQNRELFGQAQALGIKLPSFILAALGLPEAGMSMDFLANDLELGSDGEGVRSLQKFLNSKGFVVSETGAGSPGSETSYFGSLTKKALAAYQTANGITPAVGYFGPVTRASMTAAGL